MEKMTGSLRQLYQDLIENRKNEVKVWYDRYCEFYKEVENIRERIQNGVHLSHETDREFLDKLLRRRNNGIASAGQSILSNNDFTRLIQNSAFLSALNDFIKSPDREHFQKFEKAWSDQGQSIGIKRKTPLLVNRVAAACTLDVSTTADSYKFNQVFKWLTTEENLIPSYQGEEDWFSKNFFLMRYMREQVFQEEVQRGTTDTFYLSMFVWELYSELDKPFSLKKQIIKYGPPGTGKTYTAREQTRRLFNRWKEEFATDDTTFSYENQAVFVQFHPSYSYEDFIEGLRPVPDQNGTAQLKLQNGIFKDFCKEAGKWEIDLHNIGLIREDNQWDSIKISDCLPYQEKLTGEHWQYIFKLPDQDKRVSDVVPPFFFIIDEVNRAELSRVFGELMYCLEYRGVKGSIKTQYANLNDRDTGMLHTAQGYKFFIPSNIYLIGTMNTIDRSIESFDFALRRRFQWEEVKPDTDLLKNHLSESSQEWEELAQNLKKLNDKITEEPLLGRDYQIGHAYLMNLTYDPEKLDVSKVRKYVWEDCICPLLQEYLRGTGKEQDLIKSFQQEFGIKTSIRN